MGIGPERHGWSSGFDSQRHRPVRLALRVADQLSFRAVSGGEGFSGMARRLEIIARRPGLERILAPAAEQTGGRLSLHDLGSRRDSLARRVAATRSTRLEGKSV